MLPMSLGRGRDTHVFIDDFMLREAILRLAEHSGNVFIGKKKKVSLFVNKEHK